MVVRPAHAVMAPVVSAGGHTAPLVRGACECDNARCLPSQRTHGSAPAHYWAPASRTSHAQIPRPGALPEHVVLPRHGAALQQVRVPGPRTDEGPVFQWPGSRFSSWLEGRRVCRRNQSTSRVQLHGQSADGHWAVRAGGQWAVRVHACDLVPASDGAGRSRARHAREDGVLRAPRSSGT